MSIYENAVNLMEEIRALNPEAIVIGASKTKSADDILEARRGGIEIFAENRVQEFLQKKDISSVRWHFIGRLQTNKVKHLVGEVEVIHSVDSFRLAEEIDKRAKQKGIIQDIMVEINGGEEEDKGGIMPDELIDFLVSLEVFSHINIVGIMPVLPIGASEELYIKMRALFDKASREYEKIVYFSMGMSNDYGIALKYGANVVRIGRGIFGDR